MSNRVLLLVLAAILAYSGWSGGRAPNPSPAPSPSPAPAPSPSPAPAPSPSPAYVPSAELQAAVAPVGALVRGKFQAPILAGFYLAAADVIGRDATIITNTERVARWMQDSSTLQIQHTDIAGTLPGLAKAHYDAVASQIGADPSPLDPDKRRKLVEVLKALAWACGGSS